MKFVETAGYLKLPKDSRMLQVHLDTLVKKDILLRSSFKEFKAASMRWHRNLASIEDSLGSTKWGGLETSWRGLLSDRRVEGYDVKEITSDAGLTRRGRTENHCVGGYGPMVRAAGTENNLWLLYTHDADAEPHL